MSRHIIIGDVHGCLDELNELIEKVEYRPGGDELVFVGDLVDRGPDSAGVLRRARELGAVCVLGNHEWKHLRFRQQREEGKVRVEFSDAKVAIHDSVPYELWEWVASWPVFHRIHDKLVVVHAGLQRGVAVDQQETRVLTMMRYADRETGKMAGMKLKNQEMLRPATSAFWAELWTGPESVIYGHHIVGVNPVCDEYYPGVKCWGIDTGCYTGKTLTAAIVDGENISFVQVYARGAYGVKYADRVAGDDE